MVTSEYELSQNTTTTTAPPCAEFTGATSRAERERDARQALGLGATLPADESASSASPQKRRRFAGKGTRGLATAAVAVERGLVKAYLDEQSDGQEGLWRRGSDVVKEITSIIAKLRPNAMNTSIAEEAIAFAKQAWTRLLCHGRECHSKRCEFMSLRATTNPRILAFTFITAIITKNSSDASRRFQFNVIRNSLAEQPEAIAAGRTRGTDMLIAKLMAMPRTELDINCTECDDPPHTGTKGDVAYQPKPGGGSSVWSKQNLPVFDEDAAPGAFGGRRLHILQDDEWGESVAANAPTSQPLDDSERAAYDYRLSRSCRVRIPSRTPSRASGLDPLSVSTDFEEGAISPAQSTTSSCASIVAGMAGVGVEASGDTPPGSFRTARRRSPLKGARHTTCRGRVQGGTPYIQSPSTTSESESPLKYRAVADPHAVDFEVTRSMIELAFTRNNQLIPLDVRCRIAGLIRDDTFIQNMHATELVEGYGASRVLFALEHALTQGRRQPEGGALVTEPTLAIRAKMDTADFAEVVATVSSLIRWSRESDSGEMQS